MLEELFGSQTRTKILNLFLENQKEAFYVREICRLINERINSVRRELFNLEKFGLIVCQQQDQKKYYHLDLNFPIVGELQLVFDKAKVLLEKTISQKALKLDGLRYFVLTGQFTKDEEVSTDVLLVGKISRDALEKFVKEIERSYGKHLRYTYFTTQEFNLRKNLTDKFLYSILNGKKIVLINRLNIWFMILAVNTSESDWLALKLLDRHHLIDSLEERQPFKQSELLLALISQLLKRNQITISQLSGLAAVSGPGAFSALRIGLATINAFALSLGIPAVELKKEQWLENDQRLIKILFTKIQKSSKKSGIFPLLPKYGKEPNITQPK